MRKTVTASLICTLLTIATHQPLAKPRPYEITENREPCADYTALRKPHFGDTHVHTTYSFDANSQDTRTTPLDAYNFAKGGALALQPYDDNGAPLRSIKLAKPLDFTAVTDHSEFLGEMLICNTPGSDGYWHPVCIAHRYVPSLSQLTFAGYSFLTKRRWGFCGDEAENCYARHRDNWQNIQADAETAYDRSADCTFTSMVGYEFTGTVGEGSNLHRNVIFRNDKVPAQAQSWIETPSAAALWEGLQKNCVDALPGCDAITIPHNSNLSSGLMFATPLLETATPPDIKLTRELALRRARWEPLIEVVQHKGDSECDTRAGWEDDKFCAFEKLPYDSFGGKKSGIQGSWPFLLAEKILGARPTAVPGAGSYIRWALKDGIRQQAELGSNSFKFGLISSSDTHISAPGLTAEKNHPGHGGAGMGARDSVPKGFPDELEFSPGGLAVIWAEENSRDALFSAMQRREVYSTSGTRPILRFFGGWEYDDQMCSSSSMVADAYANGVPMGSDLPPDGDGETPKFIVSALMDPGTANDPGNPLQRIQIIKGWHKNGETYEKVLDVAGGDNDAGVDLNSCNTYGSGHQQLCSVWEDKAFDPGETAFYYARVIENPSCRWSQHICVAAKVDCADPHTVPEDLAGCCAAEHRPVIQERALSSPIWYTPTD